MKIEIKAVKQGHFKFTVIKIKLTGEPSWKQRSLEKLVE